ncbi:sensor histidine kinase [Paenibacillus sp. 598K]|uniref:sensor histidine kinase n=1 Tax=Paenibacillus sp. 598K TaxID=1117987 RepID=UPI001628C74F|nr:histidine kinase [Paenibacillus sp. 598K]
MHLISFKRTYTKILLSLAIVLIPTFVLSAVINDRSVTLVKSQISDSIQQKTEYMMNTLEAEIERIHSIQKSFINDNDLQSLNFRSSLFSRYEWTTTVNQLHTKLQLVNSSSKYVKSTSIMMATIDKTLSSRERLIPLDQEDFDNTIEKMSQGLLFLPKGKSILLPLAYPSVKRPYILMTVEFDLDQLHRDLALLDNHAVAVSTTLLIDETGSILFDTNQDIELNKQSLAAIAAADSGGFKFGNYIVHRQKSAFLNWSLVTLFDEKTIWTPVTDLNKWHWILGAAATISVVIFSYFIYRLVHRPMARLLRMFRRVQDGNLPVVVNHDESDEFSYMFYQFNYMLQRIDHLIEQNYEKTIRNQRMELKHLQSQINPHFLYNSLYVLYRMSQEENYEGVTAMSKHLGDYFKFLTRTSGDVISLHQEVEHAKTYAAIQQIRFGERIHCYFQMEGQLDGWHVPRLIIQPLIENAYQHGHRDTYEDGWIKIEVVGDKESLTIKVSDNGTGMSGEGMEAWNSQLKMDIDTREGDGMWNVHRRIRLILGDSSGLTLSTDESGGLLARIDIQREEN